MRSFEDIQADATDKAPFSNGTMGYGWMGEWCYECKVDGPFQRDEADEGCPLLLVAMLGRTPKEWTDQGLQDYHCSEFVPDDHGDDDGEDPVPPAPTGPAVDVEGQLDILGAWAQDAIDRAQRERPVSI